MVSQDRPTLLLVGGAGAPGLGVDVAVSAITQAHARGFRVHLMNHQSLLASTAPAGDLADEVSAVDPEDTDASMAWVRDLVARGTSFEAVFTVREFSQVTAAEIAKSLGVAGNPPDVVRRARTKDACRARLTAAGFRQPSVWVCDDADAASAHLTGRGPWVVKPRDGAGSEGVSIVAVPKQLPAAVAALPENARPFLVEEFVDGIEFSVEGLFLEGQPQVLAVTAKEKLALPFFVEVGHTLPAPLAPESRRDIEEAVTNALLALELRFGLFHVELWLTGDGIVLGEVHSRLGGDYIHRLLAHAIPDLEMFGRVFDDALGQPAGAFDGECVRAASSRYLTPPPGRLVSVDGWDDVRAHPAVLVADLHVACGDLIPPIRSSDDRVGTVVVGAATAEAARELSRRLVASVRFVVEPAPSRSMP